MTKAERVLSYLVKEVSFVQKIYVINVVKKLVKIEN